MDWFVLIKFNDGNMPTYPQGSTACAQHFGNDSDARAQWVCYIYLIYYIYLL